MAAVLFLIAAILMVLGALPLTVRVDLWKIGTGVAVLAFGALGLFGVS
jgi:hypothetical protein